jgi:type IV fimbrial biogenesis protein FimT
MLVNPSMPPRHAAAGARLPRARAGGFTLVELLTVMVMVAILAAIAMPGLSNLLASQRLRAAGTDLVTSLLVARSEAIKRKARVEVAPKADGQWTSGWRVATVAGDEQIDAAEPTGLRVKLASAPDRVVYESSGRLAVVGIAQFELVDSKSEPGVEGRCVTIDPSGLPKLDKGACP